MWAGVPIALAVARETDATVFEDGAREGTQSGVLLAKHAICIYTPILNATLK